MRSGFRTWGQVLAHGAVAMLAVLGAVFVPAQVHPSAVAPATDSKPPVYPKKFYRGANGQLYVPAGVPVGLGIMLTGNSDSAQSTAEESNESSVTLKEGPTSLQFGDTRVPVIADGTPPKTTLAIDEATNVQRDGLRILPPRAKLRLSATDALSGVARIMISIDGAPFVAQPAGGPAVTQEGKHRLRYFSVDQVGNVEKVQEFAFSLDSTPPHTLMAISGPKADAVVGAGTSISLSATDADAGVQNILYRLDDNTEQTYAKPLVLDVLAEGTHHLQFHAEDMVGNGETTQNFAFVVDRTPPDIALSIDGSQFSDKGVRYVSPDTEIELAGHDAVSGSTPVRYGIDGAPATTVYNAPFHLPAVSGIHHLRLEAEDPVNNHATVAVDDIYVDMTPPVTAVDYSRPFFVQDGVIVLNPASKIALDASDPESGAESVSYSLDSGPEQKYSGPFSVPVEGDHRLSVSAIDHIGNRETMQQIRLRVQQPGIGATVPHVLDFKRFYQHPTLGLLAPPGLPFVVRITDSPDAGAQNYMFSSGPTPAPTAEPPTFTSAGKNTVKVAISKKTEEAFALSIDAAPPKTQLTATGAHRADAGGVTYFGPGLKISLASQDDPTGVVSGLRMTLYSLDGGDFVTYTTPLNEFTREGGHTLRYYAVDNVGNAETPHTLEFTVDTTAPKTQMQVSGPHFASSVAPDTHIALTASDNLSGVTQIQYSIDGGKLLTYGAPLAIGPLSVGPHRFSYFAVDVAGNREEAHNWPFTVASPVGTASYEIRGKSVERGGTVFVASGSAILLKPTVMGESVVYTLDGSAPKTYSTPIPAPELGNHLLSFHAVNDLGISGASHSVMLTADRSAPNSSVHFEGPQQAREASILISSATRIILGANAGAVGGATLEYSLGGGRWQDYTGPFSIKNSGTYDLAFRARNSLATVEATQKQRVVVDAQGPAITVTFSGTADGSSDPIQMQPGTLMFISAEDEPAGLEKVTYKLDDQPPLIYRVPLSGFSQGKTHTITIVATDLLENQTVKVIHVVVKEQAR